MDIGKNLEAILKIKNIKQKQLANAVGAAPSTVNNWINLGRSIPAELVIPICEFLKITPYELLTGKEEEKNVGIQNSIVNNSSNIEVTGIKHESNCIKNELSETAAELIRVFEMLPVKEKVRLLNMVYAYEDEYVNKKS